MDAQAEQQAETTETTTKPATDALGRTAVTRDETVSEKYLRHIRNVVVAAFIIWLAGAAIGGITWAAVSAHDHAVQQQAACNASGGIYVNGQCD
jgi:hypothetical protein